MWEKLSPHHPEFFGLGANPMAFPEIEDTYDRDTARNEAARCYRCDAETGSADYSVQHREDIFSMARTNPADHAKLKAMLHKRLRLRANPFPEGRPATLDDLVFLPANLSRLVIDPYREACRVSTDLAGKFDLEQPFLVTGFDQAPEQIREDVARGLAEARVPYLGRRPIGKDVSICPAGNLRRRTSRVSATINLSALPSPTARCSKRRCPGPWRRDSTCCCSTAAALWAASGRSSQAARISVCFATR
jgi:hypothetical protein